MDKKNFLNKSRIVWILLTWVIVISMLLSGCGNAAQSKVYHVGVISGLGAFAPAVDGFKSKMAELGYVEGKNISYDVQSTDVDIAAYKSITKKFVDDKVDMIFSFPTEATMEAKAATQGTNIPVLFTMTFTDVAGINIIDSIRAPGGNITGVRFPSSDIANKRLEILLQLAPNAKRIFVPYLKDYPNVPGQLDVIRPLAAEKGVQLVEFGGTSPADFQAELDSLVASDGSVGIDAVLMIAEPLTITPVFYSELGKFSYEHKLPIGGAIMDPGEEYSPIFGFVPDPKTAGEQAALLADKIFKGIPAGTIPVYTATSYFQINTKAAQQLGVTVPEGLLKQADHLIK